MFNYAFNCVGCPDELVPALCQMVEDSEQVTLEQFKERINPESLRTLSESLGYLDGSLPKLEDDWAVTFYLSRFGAYEVVYMDHSAVEYIFMDDRACVDLLS